MSSQVDICNQALANLGDSATVTSIDPPEGSAQAEHCARFYPMALAAILEAHPWAFATRRTALAQVSNPSTTWQYAYAKPSGTINIISILSPTATDDYSASLGATSNYSNAMGGTIPSQGVYTPQSFAVETDNDGNEIILTNQADAIIRYTVYVTDSAKFPPLFVECLGWLLSAKLAGPVLKGAEGRGAAKDCLQSYAYWFRQATASDAANQSVNPTQQVDWMNAR
jgi:hypothetical protein